MTPMPHVVAIVLNWNGLADTRVCLRSLQQQDYAALTVLLVDNGSTDGSLPALRAEFPDLPILDTGANLGFCGGNNAGIAWALAHAADYVLLLNNDTWFDPAMTRYLVAAAESDPRIGMAGPKVFQAHPPDTLWSAGGVVTYWGNVTAMRGFAQVDRGQFDTPADVDYLPGCGILVRRQVLEQIGLLDLAYYCYYEDTDWAMRARRAGWRIWYVPAATMWHKGGNSTGGYYNPREKYMAGVNAIRFMRSYARPWQWVLFGASLIVGIPWLFIREGAHGRAGVVRAKVTGLIDGFRNIELRSRF